MKQINADTNGFANQIVKIATSSDFASNNLDDLASGFQHCNKNVVSAAKSLQIGRINLDNFRDVANTATTATTGLVASLKSIAVNMAIYFAISTAIQLVVKAADALIITTEELNEKFEDSVDECKKIRTEIDSLKTELESTKDTIEQLEALPSLTFVEQEQLNELKETRLELERQLELKNALANSRYSETGQVAKDYFNSTSNYDTGYAINRDSFGYISGLGVLQNTGSQFGTPIEEANAQLKIYEQLINDIEIAEERVLEAKKAENYESTIAYKQAVNELNALEKRASEVNQSLNESYTSFSEKKVYLDPIEDSGLLQSIKEFEDELYRVLNIGTSPTDKFNDLWDSSEFRKYKLELENLSKASKLDSSVFSSNEKYKELLDATGLSASEVASHINSIMSATENAGRAVSSSSTFENAFKNLPINKLEEYVAIANSDGFNKNNIESFTELNEIVKTTGISLDDINDTIKTIAENDGFISSVDLIQGIQDSYDVLEEVKQQYADTESIGLESLNKISAQYPELNSAIAQYNQGLISSEELIRLLELAYEDDADSFRELMVEKLSSDEGFWDKVIAHNEGFFEDLAEAYGVDLRNYKTLAEAKASIDAELIKKLSIGWGEYYDAIIDPLTGLATGGVNFTGDENSDLVGGGHSEYIQNVQNAAKEYNEVKTRLNELSEKAEELISLPDFGDVVDDTGSGSGSSSTNKQEEIDWIARKNELLQEEHDWNKRIADDESKSYNQRISALNDLIDADKERAEIARSSANEYNKAWEEAMVGLKNEDIARIKEGSLDITTYTDEEYINLLKTAQDLYDKSEEAKKNALEIEEDSLEHQREEARLQEEIIQNQQDILQSKMDMVEVEMELAKAQGKYVGEGYYKDLINYSKDMVNSYEDQIDNLYEQLELVEDDSAEHYRLLGQIEDCEAAITDATVQQENWNYQIKRLPIERIQTFIDLFRHAREDLDNFLAERSTEGISPNKEQLQTYIDLNAKEIESLLKQQNKLKDLLGEQDYGSDRYTEIAEEIQSIDNDISSLIQSQIDYNNQLLQIPIDEMATQVDNLSSAKEALERSIAEDNAKGLKTTIGQYNDLNQLTVQQLSLLEQQKAALIELLSTYNEESQYYKDTQEEIKNIDTQISTLVQDQYSWNQEILAMPVEKLAEVNDNLQTYSSILDASLSDMNSAYSAVNNLLDDEISKIEELKEQTEEYYDNLIDPLQERLDLINETNEALDIQRSLEQAQYDKAKADSQKTTAIIDSSGNKVYTQDIDAQRAANEALENAKMEKIKYELQKEIDDLTEQKENALEVYDEEIDKLNDVADSWQKVVDKITQASDALKADNLFGEGWQDSILSGDTSILDGFAQNYEAIMSQKATVEEQISSNERLIQMMEEISARYQDGSLTYNEALSNISSLISSMEGGYSALENLSGMMNLDNISGLENIASSAQESINQSAELLSQYMAIVESNKQSVEGFETNWADMSDSVNETINAFNDAIDSMQTYLDVFNANADAISDNTSTWEEMKENIAAQVKALEAAAKALEEAQNESVTVKYERSDDSDDSDSEKATGVYSGKYGYLYKYDHENGTLVHPEDGSDLGVSNYKEFMEKYEEELKNGTYHKGIFKGAVKSSGSQFEEDLKTLAQPPVLMDDEVVGKLQEGELVYQPEQIENTIKNVRKIALEDMAQLLPHLRVNPFGDSMNLSSEKVLDLVEKGSTPMPNTGTQTVNNNVEVNFNGGITMNEVSDADQVLTDIFSKAKPIAYQMFAK